MDDETAEIELLEQNLHKTRQTSTRMIAILDSFDTRLAKLEKTILPLYTSTQILNRRASNIEKALLKIDEVASSREGIEAEEALVLRGPQQGQLDVYKDALERLNASIAFKSSDRDSIDTARLVETGAKKLTQMYTKLVAEGSSGPDASDSSFPSALLSTLRPLVAFLRTLPLPSTHPSHPAAPGIMATLKDAQKGYADMRGGWSRKCLEPLGKRFIDRADSLDSVAAGKEFGMWVDALLAVAEDEYGLLSDLSPLGSSSAVANSYTLLVNPLLVLFSTTTTSLVALIKRSLHRHTFLALSSYEALLASQPRFQKLFSRTDTNKRKESNELKEGLQSLRAVCLRSFPEFLADLKMASMSRTAEVAADVADFTISTVKYLERLPDVQGAAGAALLTLGDGNWKMGEGVQVSKGPKLGDGDEKVIVEHFVYDVVSTLAGSLTAVSKLKRPAFGAMYLLNNVAYVYNRVLENPRSSSVLGLLSRPTKEVINSNFRTAKAGYFDSNFSPLMQALTDDPTKEKGGRGLTKEKFTRFYDLLDEVLERHKLARVLEDDEEMRQELGDDVVKLIVPSLQRFMQKHKEKEFSKNPQKYIKLTPDAVESQLRTLYR